MYRIADRYRGSQFAGLDERGGCDMFCALEGMTAGSTVVYVLIRVRTRGPQTPVPGTGSGAHGSCIKMAAREAGHFFPTVLGSY